MTKIKTNRGNVTGLLTVSVWVFFLNVLIWSLDVNCQSDTDSQTSDYKSNEDPDSLPVEPELFPDCFQIYSDREYCRGYPYSRRFDRSPLKPLNVNFSREQNGTSSIIPPGPDDKVDLNLAHTTCSGYLLQFHNGSLRSMPVNYCDYPAIKVLDWCRNELAIFPNLSCLPELALLDLRYNLITTVPREAFVGLSNLREVKLDYNQIVFMDAYALDVPLQRLDFFTMSNNKLQVADMWFLSIDHEFCEFDLSNNLIENFTNVKNVLIPYLAGKTIGPGYVTFANNRIVYLAAQLERYGIRSDTNILRLSVLFHWGFDFRGNPINCDCSLFGLLSKGAEVVKTMWRDYFSVHCQQPKSLQGLLAIKVRLDQLVCNLTTGCPNNCTCTDIPAYSYILVDCISAGWNKMPDTMPEGRELKILLQNNSISVLENRGYFERVRYMDMRGNGLQLIEDDAPKHLKKLKTLDIRDNSLKFLPTSIQALTKDKILLDPRSIKCHCDMHWFPKWMQVSKTDTTSNGETTLENKNNDSGTTDKIIFCSLEEGKFISMMNEMTGRLSCFTRPTPVYMYVILGVVVCIVLLAGVLAVIFRYEALVLYQWFCIAFKSATENRRIKKIGESDVIKSATSGPENGDKKNELAELRLGYTHDVYVSAESNSETDLQWIKSSLIPELENRNIKSYLPIRDSYAGDVAIDETLKQMKESAVVLVLLSSAYIASQACLFQFCQAYSLTFGRSAQKEKERRRRLLVVQIDPELSSRNVEESRLKAMMRLNLTYQADSSSDMESVFLQMQRK